MNKEKDYYKILGIMTNAEIKDIKKAYRLLAKKFHPDINPGNKLYEQKFVEISEAYSILVDDQKRKQYDLLRGIIKSKAEPEQAKAQASKAYSGPKSKSKQEKSDGFFSNFTSKFSQNFKKTTPKKGEDITTDVHISVTEAHSGTIRKVNILRTETCPKTGEKSVLKQLNVKIPPKVKEGSKIRIAGEGNKGAEGGQNGDLFLVVHIIKSSYFTFDGLHVHCEVPITPTEAALGAEIQVPSLNGFINMKIPAETRSSQKFKLAGEGLQDNNSNKKGDQIVVVKIEIPPNLSQKEKDLYLELSKTRKYNPRDHIIFDK